jgi:hypothetical protein
VFAGTSEPGADGPPAGESAHNLSPTPKVCAIPQVVPARRSQRGLTRRTLLRGAAGLGVAGLLRAPAAAALPTMSGRARFSTWVGALDRRARVVAAPGRFVLAGVQWAGPRSPGIELRARVHEAGWSRWAAASTLGHGPDRSAPSEPLIGEPVWTGPAGFVELRAEQPVHDVLLHFVDVALAPADAARSAAASLPLAQPVLDAGPGQPAIIARGAWAGAHNPPAVAPGYGRVELAFVHHTDSLNGYPAAQVPAMLLAIYDFHRYTRGWDDIGYNFVVDLFGRIWEARAGGIDQPVVGAQAGGYNQESTGVAMLGTFSGVLPTPAALSALERLLAWKLSLHGLPTDGQVTVRVNPSDAFYTPFAPGAHVRLPRVAGHRQGDSTDCPGDALYGHLPAVRRRVAPLAGRPLQLTLAATPATAAAGQSIALAGRLRVLGGAPIGGGAIVVQAVHPRLGAPRITTLAAVTTAGDGSWQTAIAPQTNVLVRALHRGTPSTVSPLASVAVAPVITLAVASAAPLELSGTISPAKRRVTVDVVALRAGHRVRVRTLRVRASGGTFTVRLPGLARGRYEITAHSGADAVSAAGRSSTLRVSV